MRTIEEGKAGLCPVSGFPVRKPILAKVWRNWEEAKLRTKDIHRGFDLNQVQGDEVDQGICCGQFS